MTDVVDMSTNSKVNQLALKSLSKPHEIVWFDVSVNDFKFLKIGEQLDERMSEINDFFD
jgi:virulence-associated protein VapD